MTIFSLIADPKFGNKHVLQMLIMHHCGWSGKDEIIKQYDHPVSDQLFATIQTDYLRFTENKEPLEYILGYVQFYDRKFLVNQHTLIPRPETEYMIQAVIEQVGLLDTPANILIDVGTGCGVLGLSNYLENSHFFNKIFLTELSVDTLGVAQRNFDRLVPVDEQGKFMLLPSDILSVFIDQPELLVTSPENSSPTSTVIVANLPYIPEGTFESDVEESAKRREPKMAFVAGDDGLDLYRVLLQQIIDGAIPLTGNNKIVLFLEMMTWQTEILAKAFSKHFTFDEVKTFHQNIRIVKAVRKGGGGNAN